MGQSFAKLKQLSFDVRRSLAGLLLTRTGLLAQAARAVLLEAAQPFPNRGHGGGEQPCGRLNADALGALHQPQAMVVDVFHLPHQIEITSGVGQGVAILLATGRSALPPAGRPSPALLSLSHFNLARGMRCDGALPAASEH